MGRNALRPDSLPYALVILISLGAVIAATSTHGLGFSPDSFAYLRGAALIFSDPLTPSEDLSKFPPLYALILALLGRNLDLILIFNLVVLAANLLLLAYALHRAGVRRLIALPVLLAVGLAPEIVFRHAMVMSEPVFLLLVQAALIAVAVDRLGWALVFAALAPLQRYAGVALIAACVLVIFWRHGWRQALIFGILAALPVALWLLRGSLVGAGAREIVWHPISLDHIVNGVVTLAGRYWFAPLGFVVIVTGYFNRENLRQPPPVISAALVFIGLYLAFLVISISLFDFFTPLDSRILSPVLVLGWLVAAWLIDRLLPQLARWVYALFLVAVAGFLALGVLRAAQSAQNGVGLARAIEPGHADVILALPEGRTLYANNTVILEVLRLRNASIPRDASIPLANSLPKQFDPITQVDNPTYQAELDALRRAIMADEALLLWFEGVGVAGEPGRDAFTGLDYAECDGLRIYGITRGECP